MAVITGASSGIGAAAAKAMASAGFTLVLGARREERILKYLDGEGGETC